MKKMSLKTLLIGTLMLFAGWQSFAGGTTDTVYALANNKIQFKIDSLNTGVSVSWYLDGTAITSGSGFSFLGAGNNTLRINGDSATGFTQPSDSVTASSHTIQVVVYNAGGCYTEDTSKYEVLVLPYLKPMVVDWTDSAALCSQTQNTDTMIATKPALTGAWSTVSIDDVTWWSIDSTNTTPAMTQLSTGGGINITADNTVTPGTSTLSFPTPNDTNSYYYHAEAAYELPSTHSLIVSAGSTPPDGHAISNNVNVQALPTPVAPTLNGTVNGTVSGW
jgi:hypothetical protein